MLTDFVCLKDGVVVLVDVIVDVVVDKPVKYANTSIIVGLGEMKSKDNSQFLQVDCKNISAMTIDQYLSL